MTGQSYNSGKDSESSYRVERSELKELLRLLKSGDSVLVTGGRKIGKTVLLQQARDNLAKDTTSVTIPLYYDLMVLTRPVTAAPFFDSLSRRVAPEVNKFLERQNVRGECPAAPVAWKYDPSLEFTYYINDVLDYLDNTVGRTTLTYLLDECEQLLDSPETHTLLGNLRALVGPTTSNRVRLVVAGFRGIKEYKDPKTGTSPFKNVLRQLSLGLLGREEFDELTGPMLGAISADTREELRSRLWEVTGGHPCVIQTVCSLHDHASPPKSFDAVCEQATELLRDMAFSSWVARFNPEDHELFLRVLRHQAAPGEKPLSVEFLQYCGVLTADHDGLRAPCDLFNAWYKQQPPTSSWFSNSERAGELGVMPEGAHGHAPAATVAKNVPQERSMSGDFNFKEIQDALIRRYNIEELHDLCSALGVPFEDLDAQTRSGKAREMIYWLHRRRRLKDLEPHLEGIRVSYREQADGPAAAAGLPGGVRHDPRPHAPNPGQTPDAPASTPASSDVSVTSDPARSVTTDKSLSADKPSETTRDKNADSRPQEDAGEERAYERTGGQYWVQLIATIILGAALGTFFVLVYLYSPDTLPTYKQRILAIFSSLLCGIFAFLLTGAIGLDSKALRTPLGDISLKATGGLALFVLVLLWWLSPFAPVTPDQGKEHPNGVRTPEPLEEKIALRPFVPWRVPGAVNSVTLDSSGEGGAIAVETGAVHAWQTRPDREPLKLLNTGEGLPARSVSIGTNRETLVSGSADGTVRLFRTGGSTPPEVVRSHNLQLFEVYLSRDGQRLVTTGADAGNVKSARLWKIGSRVTLDRTLGTPNLDDDILAVSPDLQLVAIYSQRNRRIELWSIADGSFISALKDSAPPVSGGGAFSEDTRLFAAGGADGMARLWRTADGEGLKNFNGLSQRIVSVAIHPAGQMVAAGYADGTLYVWRVDDASLEKHQKVHEHRVNTLTFSRNGRILASGGEDGLVQLFEVTMKS